MIKHCLFIILIFLLITGCFKNTFEIKEIIKVENELRTLPNNLVKKVCGLKTGVTKDDVLKNFSSPDVKNNSGNQFFWLWNFEDKQLIASFTGDIIGYLSAHIKNKKKIIQYDSLKSKPWQRKKTKLSQVEKEWGKGVVTGVMFSPGRTVTIDSKYKSELSKKLLIDRCTKYYVFYVEEISGFVMMSFLEGVFK